MKTMIMAAALGVALVAPAMADTCKATADAKKLHGAALTSFLKKCTADAKTACDARAAEKTLHGAAQTSFTTKCVKDAVGQ